MSGPGMRQAVLAKLERPLPRHVRPLLALGAVAGTAAFVVLALGSDPARAWRAFHVNWLFWTGLSQAGIIFACSQVIVGARWSYPIRRMAEAAAAFLPISFVLFLVLWVGRSDLFPWIAHPVLEPPVKAFWLRGGFLFGRDIAGLLLLYGLSFWFLYHSLRLDAPGLGDAEIARSEGRLRRLAPGLVFVYAVVMSLLAFDLIMSLAPQWVSNLLGAFFFMGAWLTGLTSLALLAIQWRRHLGIEDLVTAKTLHDLGKLCFGFSVFWAYLFFSQFLVIWYGNMPEETSFLFLRMVRPEWRGISIAMVLLVFFVPFWGLIGVKPKQTPALLGTFAAVSLCGVWVDRYVLTVPSLVQQAPALPLGWQEMLVTLGFLGIWGLAYTWFARRFPIVSPHLMDRMEAEGAGGH
jgi:Ni/Fe-hydrogenase subunit HybB-like protein